MNSGTNTKDKQDSLLPKVTILIVVRNGEALLSSKIQNCLALNYPDDRLDILCVSDGSTDRTEEIINNAGPLITPLILKEHHGKNRCINFAMPMISSEIVLLTDTDAILERNALLHMTARMSSPQIGGVCGQKIVDAKGKAIGAAQSLYARFDSYIKEQESITCSISSNDGKIYCVRTELFPFLPDGVTDDFFAALSIVESGHCFVFEPKALAYIPMPSQHRSHEIIRRRRIVTGSLHAITLKRSLLNPFRFKLYAVSLFINKVLRRMLPLSLAGLLFSSIFLAPFSKMMMALLIAHLCVYLLIGLHRPLEHYGPSFIRKASFVGYYFFIGNLGCLLALWDIFRGKKINKWDPLKAGPTKNAAK